MADQGRDLIVAETEAFKRKRRLYGRVLKNYQLWVSMRESDGIETIRLVEDGIEYEFHYMDIMEGLRILPPRQREAVWLMCVEDRPEAEVAKLMNFPKPVSPVQQYKNFGLARLIEYNEADTDEREELRKKAKRWNKEN